jgi:hypothetical protein
MLIIWPPRAKIRRGVRFPTTLEDASMHEKRIGEEA